MAISTKRLRLVARQLPELAKAMQQRVAAEFAAFVKEELQRQHHTGRSIYNDQYPKPKKGNQPMFDTGELAAGYEVDITDGGRTVSVSNSSEHTIVSSDGKHTHLPDERGMPPRWKARLEVIRRKEAQRFMTEVNEL